MALTLDFDPWHGFCAKQLDSLEWSPIGLEASRRGSSSPPPEAGFLAGVSASAIARQWAGTRSGLSPERERRLDLPRGVVDVA